MRVVMKAPIYERIQDEICDAKEKGKTIDYIELNEAEFLELDGMCGYNRGCGKIFFCGYPVKLV